LRSVRAPRILPWLPVVVFVVGSASLGAEIAAARLLAPWFGASTIVWANTIATVLVALSIGYAVGGRLADRNPTMLGLSRIVLVASVLLAIVPFISGPFLRESTKAFENLSAGIFLGSLIGVGVLIAVPVLLLGMISPYAVRLQVHGVAAAGRVSGRLYAIGTVGSLTGTFLASLLLIPVVGTRRTFLVFALALALVALPGLRRQRWVAGIAALGIIGLMALPAGLTKSVTAHGTVIWEQETEYQYARVIEDSDGERRLELNEGQAVHSVYTPGEYLTGGYWDEMLVLPFAAPEAPQDVAILGSAAGTTARALAHYWPDVHVDAVEIDPAVTEVGRDLFDLHGANIATHAADARPWLHASDRQYDAILVDAYRQPYIPFYLTTRDFFGLVRAHLRPGGVVVINVGHPADSDTLEKVLTATMRTEFGDDHVLRDPSHPTNTMLLGTTAVDPRQHLIEASTTMPPEVADVARATALRLQDGLDGGDVYTDDKAPVEWLVDASLAAEAE
jgi:spermidine synthase